MYPCPNSCGKSEIQERILKGERLRISRKKKRSLERRVKVERRLRCGREEEEFPIIRQKKKRLSPLKEGGDVARWKGPINWCPTVTSELGGKSAG